MTTDTPTLNSTVPSVGFPSWPSYASDDIAAVVDYLQAAPSERSRCVSQFEHAFAHEHDCHFGIGVANGTLALELCLRTLGVGPGDEVIIPCRTFIAAASAVVQVGAVPVVADVEINSQNISLSSIQPLINENTKAIIATHLSGWPCDMPDIMALAKAHDLRVIEDCSHAAGARYHGQSVGSFGDMAAFSFGGHKIISTGGAGGMVTTNQKRLWQNAWSFAHHGRVIDAQSPLKHQSFGSNLMLSGMQAALGLAQLCKLRDWVQIRRTYADILRHYCDQVPVLTVHTPASTIEHSYCTFEVFARDEELREDILLLLIALGHSVTRGVNPDISQEPAFQHHAWHKARSLRNATWLGECCLSFELHPALSEQDVHRIGLALLQVAKESPRDV